MCVYETTLCYSCNSGTPRKCTEDRSRRRISTKQDRIEDAFPESPSKGRKPWWEKARLQTSYTMNIIQFSEVTHYWVSHLAPTASKKLHSPRQHSGSTWLRKLFSLTNVEKHLKRTCDKKVRRPVTVFCKCMIVSNFLNKFLYFVMLELKKKLKE